MHQPYLIPILVLFYILVKDFITFVKPGCVFCDFSKLT
jgi:hypothetical protein